MISFWSSARMHFWNFLYEIIIIILHLYCTAHVHCIVLLIMRHGGGALCKLFRCKSGVHASLLYHDNE